MGKTLEGGEFYTGGVKRFEREGLPTPSGVQFPAKGFEDKLLELRANHAAEIVRKYRFGEAVKALVARYEGDLDQLTEEVCTKFIEGNPDFSSYHPALVRAVAETFKDTEQ